MQELRTGGGGTKRPKPNRVKAGFPLPHFACSRQNFRRRRKSEKQIVSQIFGPDQ